LDRSIRRSTAPDSEDLSAGERVRVTHPFHPLAGRLLELVKRRRYWGADLVIVFDDGGEVLSLPAAWTDAVATDPFVVVSAGRAPFHVAALVELSGLVASLARRPDSVTGIMP
jgi:Family of unknown function (DUF5372)